MVIRDASINDKETQKYRNRKKDKSTKTQNYKSKKYNIRKQKMGGKDWESEMHLPAIKKYNNTGIQKRRQNDKNTKIQK